jgi:hypothetical protein
MLIQQTASHHAVMLCGLNTLDTQLTIAQVDHDVIPFQFPRQVSLSFSEFIGSINNTS